MHLRNLLSLLRQDSNFIKATGLLEKESSLNISAPSFFRPLLLASIFEETGASMLLLTSHTEKAEGLYQDLGNFVDGEKLRYFPSWETFSFEQLSPNRELVGTRMEVLYRLRQKSPLLMVAPLAAVLQRIAPPEEKLFMPIALKKGERADFTTLLEGLVLRGYSRNYMVEGRGEFSARGGIVDIYPVTGERPLRLEFFGDEIESIRSFDLSSQRSLREENEALIFACHEILLDGEPVKRAEAFLQQKIRDKVVQEELEKLSEHIHFEGEERYLPLFYKKLATILDYFPEDGILVFDEPKEQRDSAGLLQERQTESFREVFWEREAIADILSYYASWEELGKYGMKTLNLATLLEADRQAASFAAESIEPLLGQFDRLESLVRELSESGYRVAIVVEGESQGERITRLLNEQEISARFQPEGAQASLGTLSVTTGRISRGFIAPSLRLALFGENDLFKPKRRTRQEKQTTAHLPISSFADLRVGDYVVHVSNGIGRYLGLSTQEVAGVTKDYLVIEYARGAKLYVPVDQTHKVQKYIGADAEPPKISHLGGKEWARTKRRVRESVRSLAIDLFALYSDRMNINGYAFSPDSVWQRELEDSFPFEETPDQMGAIGEVKKDMENFKPMDRLICGDVGYGKTEVALRAAFKAIMDGKQVIFLVPTTVLAQQHFATFESRLGTFPVYIEVLSRFRSQREQREILERLREGKVDIVIGTHRLLQKDVQFEDPGLVIIDEEQRFGVAHKEQLKELRKSVDVLTLTATPIPRTLQMSLSGVRDLSIINTPPEDRYPVLTYVGEYSEEMVSLAIRREMARDGQVFYVHNRVQTIEAAAAHLGGLIPEARIAVAHGQMAEQELELVMQDFVAHNYDVLACTTIIESGLDIPNANTLIVTQAERFGLSTLYQLRGRVGRAHHRAYAYFFFSPGQNLTGPARDRLRTIGEFTELGSGLKIALRDLEIRGAGNLLGPEQHGHMAAVGFELYSQLLKEAVDELKGERQVEPPEVKVDIQVNAFIPASFIPDEALRIEAYRLIAAVDSEEKRKHAESELRDRYGPLPNEVKNLLGVCELKIIARKVGVKKIIQEDGRVTLEPLGLFPRLEQNLSRSYQNLSFRQSRGTLGLKIPRGSGPLPFLQKLIGDIIALSHFGTTDKEI